MTEKSETTVTRDRGMSAETKRWLSRLENLPIPKFGDPSVLMSSQAKALGFLMPDGTSPATDISDADVPDCTPHGASEGDAK